MGTKIYMFDNHTGKEFPIKVGTTPVEGLLAPSISELHKLIDKDSRMFCAYTTIKDYDIIVPTLQDKTILEALSSFGRYNFKIKVESESIWYTKKVWKNIILSGDIDLEARDISTLLNLFISTAKEVEKKTDDKPRDIYIVKNNRNGKEIVRTPDRQEAISVCDRNPCNIVINRDGDLVYTSQFGRVTPNSKNHTKVYKSKLVRNHLSFTSK